MTAPGILLTGASGYVGGRLLADARAFRNEDEAFARTRWSDAVSSSGLTDRYGGDRVGTRLVDSRTTFVPVAPASAFAPIRQIGGGGGWYYGNFLWRTRGFLDLLFGGVGLCRARRHDELSPGDALAFWRVESYEPDRLLRLRAEIKVPGRAWLQFETTPVPGGTEIRQTASFDASGLFSPPLRSRLLVPAAPAPPLRFCRHAPRHRGPRRAVRGGYEDSRDQQWLMRPMMMMMGIGMPISHNSIERIVRSFLRAEAPRPCPDPSASRRGWRRSCRRKRPRGERRRASRASLLRFF